MSPTTAAKSQAPRPPSRGRRVPRRARCQRPRSLFFPLESRLELRQKVAQRREIGLRAGEAGGPAVLRPDRHLIGGFEAPHIHSRLDAAEKDVLFGGFEI